LARVDYSALNEGAITVFKSVLLAVDESEQSSRAVDAAIELAKLTGASVELFHIHESQAVIGKGGGSFDNALLAAHSATITAAGVPHTIKAGHCLMGHVAKGIVEEATEYGADTIVIGSRGHTGFGSVLIGSNANKVLHLSKIPVLVVC
jgi:nucleotide-binding universal stress UspA family protein